MFSRLLTWFLLLTSVVAGQSAEAPSKPALKITPGQVIIPFDRMQRPWGELISLDLSRRVGKFRRESNDEIVSFTVLPYAELLHHAANGDLQDFRPGERAIFRLHENAEGQWVWLTYIQDEMNMLHGHKEYFYVDSIDAARGTITCTQANADRSYTREQGIVIETDAETRFWKGGKPATFAEVVVGERLRTKTRGLGKGKRRVAWEVFLDDESLLRFQAEQRAVHAARMKAEGSPGYVDEVKGAEMRLTLFAEGAEQNKLLKLGTLVRVAPAGVDRKPSGAIVSGKVSAVKASGKQTAVTIEAADGFEAFHVAGLARLWPAGE
jgi:hypothetical protein